MKAIAAGKTRAKAPVAGMAMAAKSVKPEIEIIGAQAESFAAVRARFYAVPTEFGAMTLAEGIANNAILMAHGITARARIERYSYG